MAFGDLYKTADFKSEKHVPVIDCADSVAAGEALEVKACVGAEIAHPNTTEHHIRWIRLYFQPEGGAVYEVASLEFNAHGEAVAGPNEGPVCSDPFVSAQVKLTASGTLYATSYCNIHGVWQSEKAITVS